MVWLSYVRIITQLYIMICLNNHFIITSAKNIIRLSFNEILFTLRQSSSTASYNQQTQGLSQHCVNVSQ